MLSGYADGGDNPNKKIQIVPGADKDASTFLQGHTETIARIERVAELIDGFETPFGLELLATVHWVAKNKESTLQDIISDTYAWNLHKKKFNQRQIELAVKRLVQKGWIDASIEI